MKHGQYYPLSECLSIWSVIRRWPHAPLYEIERLINDPDGLQPYEVETPSSGKPDDGTMYLHPMRRGALRIIHVHEFHDEVRDAHGRLVASDADEVLLDEYGEPMMQDYLWFLLGDVQRLERENPDYVRAVLRREKHAPAETPPRPARADPARPTGRMLRMKDATALLGIGKSAFYAWIKKGLIPQGTKFTDGATVWDEDEIRAFIASRKVRRNGGTVEKER